MQLLVLPTTLVVICVVVVLGAAIYWLDKCMSRHERGGVS